MKIYSKIIVVLLSLILLFGSSINCFTDNNLDNLYSNNNTLLTVSINKIDAVGISITSAVEIINLLTTQNFNIISSFYLDRKFDATKHIIQNPLESIFELNRQIPELLIRKIIFPFHYFF